MKTQKTVCEILVEYLEKHGYDGLCNLEVGDPGCGCGFDDFMPCSSSPFECIPAYKGLDGDGDLAFYPVKPDDTKDN